MASQDVISTVVGTGDGNAAILKVLEAQQQRLQGMQDLLTKQQQQLDSVRKTRSWEARRQPKHGYNAEEKRICYTCGSVDHISPNCPQKIVKTGN